MRELTPFSRDDLDDLVRYISRDSSFYARRFGEKVVLATRRLKDFPESGRLIPEADDPALREIIVQSYRVCIAWKITAYSSSPLCTGAAMYPGKRKSLGRMIDSVSHHS